MKLISVQSRGDRLVRITRGNDKNSWFWVCGKDMRVSFERGFLITAPLFVARTTQTEAMQAASCWLANAKMEDNKQ